jgi:hypothetical protein
MMKLLKRLQQPQGDPYNLIVFTNHPHHFGTDDEIDPRKHLVSLFSEVPRTPTQFPAALWEIHNAASLYGNIPNDFPHTQ